MDEHLLVAIMCRGTMVHVPRDVGGHDDAVRSAWKAVAGEGGMTCMGAKRVDAFLLSLQPILGPQRQRLENCCSPR